MISFDIIPVGQDQQAEQDDHTHDLSIFQKFIAGLAPGNDLIYPHWFKFVT